MSTLNYTILSGDTLNGIASGVNAATGVTYQEIESANPSKPANALQVGDVIAIPQPGGTQTAMRYTILSGDSYSAIANNINGAAGITADEIQAANPSVNASALQIGSVLVIPATASPADSQSGSTSQPAQPTAAAQEIGYWCWTWSPGSAPTGCNTGIAFSGWTDVSTAVSQSNAVIDKLSGDKYICFGGGTSDGDMTAAGLTAITNAINDGSLNAWDGIAYDVEGGDSGLSDDFAQCFAAAKAKGFKVLVTVSHSCPYGIDDGPTLMSGFFADANIDILSPQLYTSGSESANDYTWARVPWTDYANCKAAIAPSMVKASYYDDGVSYFATQGVTITGYVVWGKIS